MGPQEKYTIIANSGGGGSSSTSSSSSSNVDKTDGTMTALSVEWMAEDLNAGLQFPLGTSGPTHPPVKCLPTGVHIIVMIVLEYEHGNDTIFFTYCCSIGHKKATATDVLTQSTSHRMGHEVIIHDNLTMKPTLLPLTVF